MKTDHKDYAGGIASSAHDDEPLVAPESVSFHAFSDWIEVELERLVARWQHAAAPCASQAWMRDSKRKPSK